MQPADLADRPRELASHGDQSEGWPLKKVSIVLYAFPLDASRFQLLQVQDSRSGSLWMVALLVELHGQVV